MPLTDRDVGAVSVSYQKALTGTVKNISGAQASLLYAIYVKNTTAATAYLQVFDAAAADVTLNNTTPVLSLGMQANEVQHIELSKPLKFGTRISAAGTTTIDGNTGAAVDAMFFYA